MRALVALLVLSAASDARAQALVWPVPSYGARLDNEMLISLDADLRSVRAIDIVAERIVWQTHVQDAPAGGHDLARLPSGRILLIAGPSLIVLDGTSGAVVARHSLHGDFAERSHFHEENGICGLNTNCAFQPVDCEDARPLGAPIFGEWLSRRSYDGSEMHTGCWGFGVTLIGRRRGTLVIEVRNLAPPPGSNPRQRSRYVRLTIDARTGAIRARRPAAETDRPPPPTPAVPPPALEVVRDYNGGARRAHVRRPSDGAILARFDSDAWWLGAHAGRTVVYVYGGASRPGELRLYRDDQPARPDR
jgi:hypothetical protein